MGLNLQMRIGQNFNCRLRSVSMQTSYFLSAVIGAGYCQLSDVFPLTRSKSRTSEVGAHLRHYRTPCKNKRKYVSLSHLHMAIVNQQTNIKQKATTKYTAQFNAITGSTLLRGCYTIFKSISRYNTFGFTENLNYASFNYAALQMKITIKTTVK